MPSLLAVRVRYVHVNHSITGFITLVESDGGPVRLVLIPLSKVPRGLITLVEVLNLLFNVF